MEDVSDENLRIDFQIIFCFFSTKYTSTEHSVKNGTKSKKDARSRFMSGGVHGLKT